MALPGYFFINGYEIGGTKFGKLQYLAAGEWVDLGEWAAVDGQIIINSEQNPIPIDYNIFQASGTYLFRLVDAENHPVSNIIEYTFPGGGGGFDDGFDDGFDNVPALGSYSDGFSNGFNNLMP